MKILNDISTGALCGTVGFFSSKMTEVPVYSQIVTSMACALVFNATLYRHPYFNPDEHKVLGTISGMLTTLTLGWVLHSGFSVPSYVVNPLILCCSLLLSFVAASFNVDSEAVERRENVRLRRLMQEAA